MFETLELTRMARALAAHSGARLATVAQNMANADTPGFRPRDTQSFGAVYATTDFSLRTTRDGHFAAKGSAGSPSAPHLATTTLNGNGVSLEEEMMRAAEAKQAHEMALAITSTASSIQRAALGRK